MGSRYPSAGTNQSKNQSFDQTLSFFNRLLREGSDCRLSDEYPLVFKESARDHLFTIAEAETLQAGLACLEREIEIAPGRVANALFIGSVVTDPRFRNQGLQRKLFESLEWKAREWGIDMLVLWSNQIDFYEKLGFFLGGLQASWFAPAHCRPLSLLAKNTAKLSLSGESECSEEHFKAFSQKKLVVHRSFEEMQQLWKIPKMLIAQTDRAYALVGKGEDFANVLHEWAGPAEEVLACIDLLAARVENLRLLTPGVLHTADEHLVTQRLEDFGWENRLEYLGLIKMLSPIMKPEDLDPENIRYPFFIWGLDSI